MFLLSHLIQKQLLSINNLFIKMPRKNRCVNKFAQRKRDKKEMAANPPVVPPVDNRRYEEIVRENAQFEQYYKVQKVCPEEEWDQFMGCLKSNLPTAFRITNVKGEVGELMKIVESKYFSEILQEHVRAEGCDEEIKPIKLPWYPGGLAWQLQLSRTDIRRNESLYKLHNFLVAETEAGGVSRQETVSMIPPVVLDVEPHHKVLDMCAAPGSKTAQLIEFLHAEGDEMPTGLVVANDVDNSRCYMLVHQAKRLNSPCLFVCNHDSAKLPNMQISDPQNPSKSVTLKFDRVLCDVPCSGDGTLRKNPDIWTKWSVGNGNNLHGIQFRILRRGCEVLAVGGRLVYSTCSLNPVENEAVVARLLQVAEGAMRLVDVSAALPGLKHTKGMTHWRPASKNMEFYDKFEDVPKMFHTVVRPQMFPPTPEEVSQYGLDKCIRILPHQQDTGGFFVAVFEKTDLMPWEKNENAGKNGEVEKEKSAEEPKEPARKRKKFGGYMEDPFVFFTGDTEEVYPSIKEFYELSDDFDARCLLTRCRMGKKRNVYLVSPTVRDVVQRNQDKIKIINTGIKTFVRCDNKKMSCAFRMSQEGLASIFPYMGPGRCVRVSRDDLVKVLVCDSPTAPVTLSAFSQRTQDLLRDLRVGSCVLKYRAADSDLALMVVGWRGVFSLRSYTTRADTVHYLRLLGEDYSQYEINKFKKAVEAQQTREAREAREAPYLLRIGPTCPSEESDTEELGDGFAVLVTDVDPNEAQEDTDDGSANAAPLPVQQT